MVQSQEFGNNHATPIFPERAGRGCSSRVVEIKTAADTMASVGKTLQPKLPNLHTDWLGPQHPSNQGHVPSRSGHILKK